MKSSSVLSAKLCFLASNQIGNSLIVNAMQLPGACIAMMVHRSKMHASSSSLNFFAHKMCFLGGLVEKRLMSFVLNMELSC